MVPSVESIRRLKAGMVLFAGKTVWSIPERLNSEVLAIRCYINIYVFLPLSIAKWIINQNPHFWLKEICAEQKTATTDREYNFQFSAWHDAAISEKQRHVRRVKHSRHACHPYFKKARFDQYQLIILTQQLLKFCNTTSNWHAAKMNNWCRRRSAAPPAFPVLLQI